MSTELTSLNSSISDYQHLISSYKKFTQLEQTDPQRRQELKAIFASIAKILPSIGLETPPALDRDVYYLEARAVLEDENKPAYLKKLAESYRLSFKEIITSIENPPEGATVLKEKFEQLGKAHHSFAKAIVTASKY